MSRSRLPSDQRPTCSYPIQPSLNKKNEKDEKKKMSTAPFNLFATLTTPPSLAVRYSCPTHSRSPPFWHMHHPLAHHPLDPLAPTQPARADPSSCPATLSVPSHTFTLSPPPTHVLPPIFACAPPICPLPTRLDLRPPNPLARIQAVTPPACRHPPTHLCSCAHFSPFPSPSSVVLMRPSSLRVRMQPWHNALFHFLLVYTMYP